MEPSISPFEFRPLTAVDLPVLHRWLHAPHAVKWFGGERSLDDLSREYLTYIDGSTPVRPFIVVCEGRDIGMMTWERMGDFPDLQRLYGVEDPDSANCDVLIGEGDAAHRGLGAALIRAFLEREIFADQRITSCVIDPFLDNAIAIRAYEKAGFHFCRVAPDDGDGRALYLMELRRDEMSRPPADSGPAHLRPARETEIALASEIDDDACKAFDDLGPAFSSQVDPAFIAAELARWSEAARASRMLMACPEGRAPVGFSAVGYVDDLPYVHQLSVRRAWARKGIGRLLLERAQRWSSPHGELWLTTYDNVPWNAPWYERVGFSQVNLADCGPQLRALFEIERRALPAGEHRIVMRYRHQSRAL